MEPIFGLVLVQQLLFKAKLPLLVELEVKVLVLVLTLALPSLVLFFWEVLKINCHLLILQKDFFEEAFFCVSLLERLIILLQKDPSAALLS